MRARMFGSAKWSRMGIQGVGCAVLVLLLAAAPAGADVQTFSSSAPIQIPPSGQASPYPSEVFVSGMTGTVTKVTVGLRGLSHPSPADVDVLLVSPGGATTVLLSDTGGSDDAANLDLPFDDDAPSVVPAPMTSGTWRPTNDAGTDPFPPPAPPAPYGSTLGESVGTPVNGPWRLYVVDDSPADAGGVIAGGWSLTITSDTRPAVLFDAASTTVFEGAPVTIGVDRPDGFFAGSATVPWSLTPTTLSAIDAGPREGTVVFGPGQTTATIQIQTLFDDLFEGDETAAVTLGAPSGDAKVGRKTHELTV